MDQFGATPRYYYLIQKYLLPPKSRKQIYCRIKNLSRTKAHDNPIKRYKEKKILPENTVILNTFSLSKMIAPKYQPLHLLPKWCKKFKNELESRLNIESKALEDTLVETLNSQPQSSTQLLESDSDDPKRYDKLNRKLRKKARSKPTDKKKRRERLKPPTKTDLTPFGLPNGSLPTAILTSNGYVVPIKFSSPMKLPPASLDLNPQRHLSLTDGTSPYLYTSDSGAVKDLSEEEKEKVAGRRAILPAPESGDREDNPLPAPKLILLNPAEASVAIGQSGQKQLLGDQHSQSEIASCESDKIPLVSGYTTGSVRSCGSGNVPVIQNCSGNVVTVSGNTVFAPNSSSSGNLVIAPNSSSSGNMVIAPNSSSSGNMVIAPNISISGNTVISPNSPSCGNMVISSNSSTSGNVMIPSNYTSSGNMVITTNCSTSGNILVASNSYSSRNMVVAPTSSESVTLVPSSEKTVLIPSSSSSEKTTPVPISSGNIKVSAIQNMVLQKNTTTGNPTQQNVVMQKNPGNTTLQNVIIQKNPGNTTLENVAIHKNPGNPILENMANNPLQNVVIQKNPVHGNQPLAASYSRSGHIPIIPKPSSGSYSVVQTSSTGNVSVFQLSGSLTGNTADIQSSVQLPVDVGNLPLVHNNQLLQVLDNGQICILQNPPAEQVSEAQGFASSKTEVQNSTISDELTFPDFMDTSSPMDLASSKTEGQQSVQNSAISERQPSLELMDTSSSIGLISSKTEVLQNSVNSVKPLELMNSQSGDTWSGTETINAAPSPMQTPLARGEPEMIQTPSSSSCPSVSGHSSITVPSGSGHSNVTVPTSSASGHHLVTIPSVSGHADVTVPSASGHHLVTIPTSSVSGHSSGPSSTLVPCASGHGTTIAPSFSGHSHVVPKVSGHDTTMSPGRHSHVAVPSVGGQSNVALPSVSGHSLVTTTSVSGCVTIPSVCGLSPDSVPSACGHPTIPTSCISGHHYAHVPSASGHVTTTVPSASGLIPSVSASQSLPPNTNQNPDNQTNDIVDSNPGSVPIEVDEPNPPPTPESKTVVAIPQHNLSGIVLTPVHSPAISVVHSPMPASIMDTEVRNPDRGTFPSPMMDRDVRNPEEGPNPDEVTPTKLTDQSMNLTESSGCTSTFSSSFSASTDSSTICKAVEIMATLAPYYNSYLATPTLTQQEMETTPTKRPRYRELKPKEGSSPDPLQSTPVFKMPETFPKKVSTPDTKKQARPILPKCSVGDGKISPTKRAANHIKRRAQRMYQKGSSPGKLILPKPPEQLPLPASEQRIPETVADQTPVPKVPASFGIKDSVQTVPEVQETLDSHQEAAKRENANNSAAMTSQDTSTGEEDARPEPVVPALRRSKRRATISKTLETKEASTPRPVVEAAPVVGESPTEEEEDRNTDDQDHIDELMTASTTIRFNPRKPNLDESGTRKTKSQRRKELDTAMLAPDILESDPKRDDRDTAFAQAYIQTVKEKLLHDPDTYERFLTMMCEFGKGNQTPIQLYQELCSLFERYPDLIEDFAGFLRPDEAVACDCFMANQEFQRAVEFLRKVEINFHRQPAQFQKVLKTFTKWQQTPNHSLEEVRGQIRALIKNSPILLEDFDLFFPEHRVPPSHTSNPDNFEDVDLTSMDMEDETNFDGFEEVHIPTDLDTYRTKRCKCDCHINSNDAKIRSKLKHCYACCLKNVDGGLYFQPSKNKLIPVKVVYYPLPEKYKAGPPPPSPSPSSPLFKSPASTTPLKQRHWAPPPPTVTSPPQGQSSRVLPSVSPLKHCSLKKAKKMKIKTNKNQPGQKRFLSLNEITSPVKGTMTASRETDRVTISSTSNTPTSGTTTKPLGSGGILSLPYPSPVLHVPPPPSSTVTSAMMHQSRDVDDYPPLSCTTSSPVLVSQTVGDSDSMTGAVIRIPDNPFNLDVGNMSLSNFLDASRSMGLFDLANEVSSKPWLFNENSSDILAKALKAAEISVDSNFFRNLMSSPSKSQFATSTNPPAGEPLSFKGAVGSLITPTLSQTEPLSSSHPQTEPLSFKGAVEPLTSHPSFKGSVEALTTTSTHPSFKGTVQPLITTQQNTEPLSFKGAVEPLITTTQQQSEPLSFKGETLITPTHQTLTQPLSQPLSFKGTVEALSSTDIFPSISAVDSILSHPIQTTPSGVSSDITALPPRDKPEGMFPGIQEYLTPDVPTSVPDQPSPSVSSVTKSWTMETDKIILEMCQSQGPGDETFALISEKLVNKSPQEVSQRFQSLMEVLSESHEDSDDE